MKVILLEDMKTLGKAGDIKEVRNGYGFNFLLPNGLVEIATPQAIRQAERLVAKRRKELDASIKISQAEAAELEGKQVVIKTKAEHGKLFGSVGRSEIAAALDAMGIKVDAGAIRLAKPLKEAGVFPIEADFGQGAKASFEVTVEAE